MKIMRFAGLAAASLMVVQMLGAGTAFAADSSCDFGSDDLEITLVDDTNVDLWIEGAKLYCNDDPDIDGGFDSSDIDAQWIMLRSLDSITVEMDDEQSYAFLYVSLQDEATTGDSADWPTFDTFDLNVSTEVYVDASGVTESGYNALITVGAKSISFQGTTATAAVRAYDIQGTDGRDTIDGSKATARLTIDANDGNDLVKGGSGRDIVIGGDGYDVIYGNGGDDDLDGSNSGGDVCWGGEGDDAFTGCKTVGPGAGDDEITSLGESTQRVNYGDLAEGVVWYESGCNAGGVSTGGAAGDDYFSDGVARVYTGAGDDVITAGCGILVLAGAGNDLIRITSASNVGAYGQDGNDRITDYSSAGYPNYFYGGPGNDVLLGRNGEDHLDGGSGKDRLNGGEDQDVCRHGEVVISCGGTPA